MACVKWKLPTGDSYWASTDVPIRHPVGAVNTGEINWDCGSQVISPPSSLDNLTDVFNEDGFMVGNAVKKITNAIGITQCLSCKGRQQNYNRVGLEIQQKIKDLF